MLLTSLFMGLGLIQTANAATILVPSEELTIQKAINNATAGDTIIVDDGYYAANVKVNKSVIIKSANGSDVTWINGTVNITVDDVSIGAIGNYGFTIYQATRTAGTNAINIGTNGSRDNIDILFNEIIGGFNGIQIGRFAGGTTDNNTNITISSNMIQDSGGSAIQAIYGWLKNSMIYANQILSTSNVAKRAAIKLDGAYNTDIYTNVIHDTTVMGGEGINVTGLYHPCDDVTIQWNYIYDVDGYSPIVIRSLSDTEYVQNMRIISNELSNYSKTYAEPGIRFDNVSGRITATNISVFFNNITSTSRDIEERFALTADYDNWTGVMPAYFNWYGSAAAGTFRYSSHLLATPYLLCANAYNDISLYGTVELTGFTTSYVNNTYAADTNVSGTSTGDLIVVVYPYPKALLSTYPPRSMHKYVEIGLSDAGNLDFPANITIYYTAADLTTRGWSERYIHGLVFYNGTSGEWEQFNNTGASTNNTWGSYAGYVWANVYSPMTGTIVGIDYNTITEEEEEDGGTTDGETETGVDTDGDGYTDTVELQMGSDPNDPLSTPLTMGAMPAWLGIALPWWILIIVILAIIIFFVLVLTNKKLRKKIKW